MSEQSQLGIFDPPISRKADPNTSKIAEARQNLGPRAKRQREVLSLVRRYPRLTHGEYARKFVAENPRLAIATAADTPGKRLPDLIHKGLIRRVAQRKCTDSGYECWTYEATATGLLEDLS